MNSSRYMRISAMVIVGLYTAFLIPSFGGGTMGQFSSVFTAIAILVAVGIMFLSWKRPLAGGIVVLFLALLVFLLGSYQWIKIYGVSSGGFLLLIFFLISPLLLAGMILLNAQRKMK